ncbi:MAG: M20/M25/M40 family metallo-hydrolase [Elusimicrobia bacterium]|nr:M20/M25/M40 family metallo-hydrolase [Elusimicrobiota bacterium]
MNNKHPLNIIKIAKQLLEHPSVPFKEDGIRNHILEFCQERNVPVSVDNFGNVLAEYGKQFEKNLPLCFSAHMDHPGFIIEKYLGRGKASAITFGDFPCDPLKPANVRIFGKRTQTVGKIIKVIRNPKQHITRIVLSVKSEVANSDFGLWDFPPCRTEGGLLHSRGCDDLVGCAAMLTMIDQLVQRKIRHRVMCVFTVAEEAGLHGANYLCMNRTIPSQATVISLETSKALPVAPIHGGVIIRVGDKQSIFHPGITAFLVYVAQQLKLEKSSFKYNRKLMDGGTCEGTAYQDLYKTGALCIPLGNYHNRNNEKNRIDEEYVAIDDLENMVRLLVEVVINSKEIKHFTKKNKSQYQPHKGLLGEIHIEKTGSERILGF